MFLLDDSLLQSVRAAAVRVKWFKVGYGSVPEQLRSMESTDIIC